MDLTNAFSSVNVIYSEKNYLCTLHYSKLTWRRLSSQFTIQLVVDQMIATSPSALSCSFWNYLRTIQIEISGWHRWYSTKMSSIMINNYPPCVILHHINNMHSEVEILYSSPLSNFDLSLMGAPCCFLKNDGEKAISKFKAIHS